MLKSIREQIGTAGLIVAVVALVAAVGGSAVAATGNPLAGASGQRNTKKGKQAGLNAKQKQQVQAIAKSFQGTGPAGPQGSGGPAGAAGAAGASGASGKSVVVDSFTTEDEENEEPAGEPCLLNGGNEVKVEGSGESKFVCNGSPWTAGSLPVGATETGAWAGAKKGLEEGTEEQTAVSFAVPLESAPTFTFVPAAANGHTSSAAGCPGVSGGTPQANSGKLCVYGVGTEITPVLVVPGATVGVGNPTVGNENHTATPAGAKLELTCPTGLFGSCVNYGVWAVTG